MPCAWRSQRGSLKMFSSRMLKLAKCGFQRAPPVFSSAAWTASSAEDMPRPKGCGNSMRPHFLPLLKAAVSSSSPLQSRHRDALEKS